MEKNRVKVRILGETFTVKGSLPPSYIERIANYVDNKMQLMEEQNPKLSQQKIIMLACLNLADEVLKLQDEIKEMEDLFNEKGTS